MGLMLKRKEKWV